MERATPAAAISDIFSPIGNALSIPDPNGCLMICVCRDKTTGPGQNFRGGIL